MESFRDFDAATFRAGHHADSITVFASGATRYGVDAIMAALQSHFDDREALWSWTELHRVVDGCRSAFILYDAMYEIPSTGYRRRRLVGVTYTQVGDRWLVLADMGSYFEPPEDD
jgi:transcriptional regulator of nitric oxide reductase